MKTKLPVRFFLWIILDGLFAFYLASQGMVVWGTLIYFLGILLLYWVASNKDCSINLTEDGIEIKFVRSFWKSSIYLRKDIEHVRWTKAEPFWRLVLINNSIERNYRSHDKLLLFSNEEKYEVLINTNRTDLEMLINRFNQTKKLSQ